MLKQTDSIEQETDKQNKDTIQTQGLWGLPLQLALSFLLVGSCALGLYCWLLPLGMPTVLVIVIALLVAVALGLLLTSTILYALWFCTLVLTRIAGNQPGNTLETGWPVLSKLQHWWYWPLHPLTDALHLFGHRIGEITQQARYSATYREQVVQQAAEAAAAAERNRLARELHDSIKQQIFSISISAAAAQAHASNDATASLEAIQDIQSNAKEAQVEMQALLQQLRPSALEHTNLHDALQTQAQALGFRTGAHIHCTIAPLPAAERFPLSYQESVFRLIQEAFANIARHARAQNVWLQLQIEHDTLLVVIRDDGQGFDLRQARKGMGLTNLHERARAIGGQVTLTSSVGAGTTVQASIPLLLSEQEELQRRHEERAIATWKLQIPSFISLGNGAAIVASATMGLQLLNIIAQVQLLGIYVVALCLCIICYAYIQANIILAKLHLYRGRRDTDTLSLHIQLYNSYFWLLGTCWLGCWYLFITVQSKHNDLSWWLSTTVTIIAITLMLLLRWRLRRLRRQYYAQLAGEELRWQLRERSAHLLLRGRLWSVLAGLFLIGLLYPGHLLWLMPAKIYLLNLFLFIILLIMVLLLWQEYATIRQWLRKLSSEAITG